VSATPKAARTAVHAALIGVDGLAASAVLDHEPQPASLPRPKAVTVSPAGVTPYEWEVAVRCYVDTTADIVQAQDDLDQLVLACEQELTATITPRTTWTYAWLENLGAYVATTRLAVPREDF
jgi:hypothetical protein